MKIVILWLIYKLSQGAYTCPVFECVDKLITEEYRGKYCAEILDNVVYLTTSNTCDNQGEFCSLQEIVKDVINLQKIDDLAADLPLGSKCNSTFFDLSFSVCQSIDYDNVCYNLNSTADATFEE